MKDMRFRISSTCLHQGIDIKSETTHEIAIRVAAQLIEVKNKKLKNF